jgi:RimJ/RimL family protein N-acetyltransferase
LNITLKPFTETEYHQFFKEYVSDPLMEPMPFIYNEEAVSRSYRYNYGGREHYAHYGVFSDNTPIGCFQLKRMDEEKKTCEFGLILQHDGVKNKGIGTEAVRQGMIIARDVFRMKTILADTTSGNFRMIRVFQKLGFELIETVPHAYKLLDGRVDDRLVYRKDL